MDWLGYIFHSVSDAVYAHSLSARSTLRRYGLRLFLVLLMAAHRFKRHRGFGRATELAYRSLFALVPVTALALMIITSFASSTEDLERFLFQHMLPTSGSIATDYVRDFARQAGTISIVSSLLLIVTAVSLLVNIEFAINDIWEIREHRRILVKLAAYWTLLTLGPILLFSSVYLTTQIRQAVILSEVLGIGTINQFVTYSLSFLFVWIVGYLVYTWLPNTRVTPYAGLVGSIVAGTLWQGAKFGFDWYVAQAVTYNRIYGSLSVVPLFLLWLYLTWIIVLWGSQISFVWQHLTKLKAPEFVDGPTGWHRVDAALRILVCIGRRFQVGAGKVSDETLIEAAQMGTQQMREILSVLETAHMIHHLDDREGWYTLARPPDTIALYDVVALFDGIESCTTSDLTDSVGVYTATLGTAIRQAIYERLAGKTVKNLMDDTAQQVQDNKIINTISGRP